MEEGHSQRGGALVKCGMAPAVPGARVQTSPRGHMTNVFCPVASAVFLIEVPLNGFLLQTNFRF